MAGAVERGKIAVNFVVNSAATIPAYYLVKNASSVAVPGAVALWDTSAARMIGLSCENSSGATGTSIQVAIAGTAYGSAGGSISAGCLLTGLTATGQVIEAGAATNDIVTAGSSICYIGQAMGTIANTGASVEVYINIHNLQLSIV
jgi:hypothetical protein